MCGIIGYVGTEEALPVLINGLKRLEYRGYDSAGVALLTRDNHIKVTKCKGKVENLESMIFDNYLEGSVGLGHTRWATHGKPDDINAHPHLSEDQEIVVVHNGIIENYIELKETLLSKGAIFHSETDTEVLPYLIQENYYGNLTEAVKNTLKQVEGTYAIGVICRNDPGKMVVSRKGSPLVIGIGNGAVYIASDIPALLSYTRQVIFLEEREIATIERNNVRVINLEGEEIKKEITYIDWDLEMAEKGGYKHFMLKEIHEQPLVIRNLIQKYIENGQLKLPQIDFPSNNPVQLKKIHIIACGTAAYAALVGKYVIENLSGIPVEVDFASEFRYKTKILDRNTLGIVISQSGETADTIAAMRSCKKQLYSVFAIVNVKGSTISRECDQVMYIHAGPEIGVASTKAFIGQIVSLYLIGLYLGRMNNRITLNQEKSILTEIIKMPHRIESILNHQNEIKRVSEHFCHFSHFLYLGRDVNYPIALEGALKLKEISYIHAEAYPAGEMKHGPIALLDENFPVLAISLQDHVYPKMINNIKEVSARDAKVIAIASTGDEKIGQIADEVIYIPKTLGILSPILAIIPLQLFAYYIADLVGRDVDKPRNLAKSVTVE